MSVNPTYQGWPTLTLTVLTVAPPLQLSHWSILCPSKPNQPALRRMLSSRKSLTLIRSERSSTVLSLWARWSHRLSETWSLRIAWHLPWAWIRRSSRPRSLDWLWVWRTQWWSSRFLSPSPCLPQPQRILLGSCHPSLTCWKSLSLPPMRSVGALPRSSSSSTWNVSRTYDLSKVLFWDS